ncbi:hypothetical protein JW835_02905 [bacterium]|nr:hypothetical protein [bacterium]
MASFIYQTISQYRDVCLKLIAFYKNPSQTWSQLQTPEDEWKVIREMAVWALPSAIARFLCWGYWQFGAALLKAFVWYILLLALMAGIGKFIHILAILFETEIDETIGMQLSFFSFLPLLMVGVLYVNPLLGVLVPIISLFGLYIFYHGVEVHFLSLKNKILFLIVVGFAMVFGVWVIGALSGGLFLPKYIS